MKLTKLFSGFSLAEGPLYDSRNERLYFVDINKGNLHFIKEEGLYTFYIGEYLSAVFLTTVEEVVLLAVKDTIYSFDFRTKEKELLYKIEFDNSMRFNDGKVSPSGEIYIGTMGINKDRTETGKLYKITKEGIKEFDRTFTIPNGLDWQDGNFYHIDTTKHQIFKYKEINETLKEEEVITLDGVNPDGMTISASKKAYVAVWGSGRVFILDLVKCVVPNVIEVDESKNVSSVIIGGREMNTLYITSAEDENYSGAIYKLEIEDKGVESNLWKI